MTLSLSLGLGLTTLRSGGGVPANALTLNGQLITLNAQPITKAA